MLSQFPDLVEQLEGESNPVWDVPPAQLSFALCACLRTSCSLGPTTFSSRGGRVQPMQGFLLSFAVLMTCFLSRRVA